MAMNYNSGSQSEPYRPASDHADFQRATGEWWKIRGHSNIWVGHQNFTAWIKYFKFKTESKVSFSPLSPTTKKAKLYFIAFPTAYLVESGFSWVILLSKVCNHHDIVNRDDLLPLTTLQVGIQKLASVHQAQETRV